MLEKSKDNWKHCDYCENDSYGAKKYILKMNYDGYTTICESCLNKLIREVDLWKK